MCIVDIVIIHESAHTAASGWRIAFGFGSFQEE
jgi:hypothetical protein